MKIGIAERPIAIIALGSDGPRKAASAMARIRKGAARSASVKREMTASVQPLRYPASTPSGTPRATAIRTDTTPARSDACAPQIMRERTSRPISSVPNGMRRGGGLRTADQSVSAGPGIGRSGARRATATKKTTMPPPSSAAGFLRNLAQARLCRRRQDGIGPDDLGVHGGGHPSLMRGFRTR